MAEQTIAEMVATLEDDFYATTGAIRPVVLSFTESSGDRGFSCVVVSGIGPLFIVTETWCTNCDETEHGESNTYFATQAQAESYAAKRRADPPY